MKISRKAAGLVGGAWIVTVALAFYAGFKLNSGAIEEQLSELEKQAVDGDTQSVERAVMIRKLTGSAPDPQAGRSFSPQAREALVQALRENDAEKRGYALDVILSGLPLGDIGQAISLMESLPSGPRQDELIERLMQRWAELDGRSALAFALERLDGRQRELAIEGTLAGWAKADPRSAFDWATANPGGNAFASQRLSSVIRSIAEEDAQLAFQYAQAIEQGSFRTTALISVVDQIFSEGNFEPRLAWFADMPEGIAKDAALAHAMRLWSQYEPAYAADWIESTMATGDRLAALSTVAATWAANEPELAAAWASQLEEGAGRSAALKTAIDTWLANGDVNTVAEWLNRQPSHPDLDQAVSRVATSMLQEDPAAAMTWAESIIDDGLRNVTMTMVGSRWMASDPDAAGAYYDSAGIEPPGNSIIFSQPAVRVFQGGTATSGASATGYQQFGTTGALGVAMPTTTTITLQDFSPDRPIPVGDTEVFDVVFPPPEDTPVEEP